MPGGSFWFLSTVLFWLSFFPDSLFHARFCINDVVIDCHTLSPSALGQLCCEMRHIKIIESGVVGGGHRGSVTTDLHLAQLGELVAQVTGVLPQVVQVQLHLQPGDGGGLRGSSGRGWHQG